MIRTYQTPNAIVWPTFGVLRGLAPLVCGALLVCGVLLACGTLLVGSLTAQEAKLPRGESVISAPPVGTALSVHNAFQTNMVLQRDKPVKIWGWGTPEEKVTVAFGNQKHSATAGNDRAWSVMLTPMQANSKPQTMSIQGTKKTLQLENILIGDVWVLGGQSNMEFPLARVEQGNLEIVSANYDGIRLLTIPQQGGPETKSGFPRIDEWSSWSNRHFRKGDWDVCSPDAVREFSGIGYVFARRIHMAGNVPIGVIDASVGGTTVETWTPRSVLEQIDTPEVQALRDSWVTKIAEFDPQEDLEARIKKHAAWEKNMKDRGQKIPADRRAPTEPVPGPIADKNRPGNCFNNLISPIAGLTVKGAIFHQGYNNALGSGSAGAAMYAQIFPQMITAWRDAFSNPEMPFGIISLCTDGPQQTLENYLEMMVNDGIYIRAAQYQTFLDFHQAGDKQIGFASSFDQRRAWYHPQKKVPVGERIACWALATQYGKDRDIHWLPPTLKEMNVEDGRIVLRLDKRVLSPERTPIVGFAIAGEDRRFQPAEAEWLVTGKDSRGRPQTNQQVIVLSSSLVPKPVHFRYAWGRNPLGNLKSNDNSLVPFATQRSDDWKIEEVPFKDADEELTKRQIQSEMRAEDLKRRLIQAQVFVDEQAAAADKSR